MSSDPLKKQREAFEAYRAAHFRMLETHDFGDAMAAKEAWWKFLNTFEAVTAEPIKP